MKKILYIALVGILLTQLSPLAYAQVSIEQCKQDSVKAIGEVLKGDQDSNIKGYLRQLDDLNSTGIATYLLIDEVQELARNLRIEVRGICSSAATFDAMDEYTAVAYDLRSCRAVDGNQVDALETRAMTDVCLREAGNSVDAFLDSLNRYLVQQAVRSASEPLVNRFRALNGKLTVLLSSYSRLINNFFTFSFRLGGRITGERD